MRDYIKSLLLGDRASLHAALTSLFANEFYYAGLLHKTE